MNIAELIDANAHRHPDKTALCDWEGEFTFQEVRDKSEQAAACFQSLGVKKGDLVAMMGQNSFDFVFSFFGVLKAGAAVVPVNHKLTAAEVDYILENSKACLFVFDGSLRAVAEGIQTEIQKLCMDSKAEGFAFLGDALAKAPVFTPVDLRDDDMAEVLYTSGTTGRPKGCVHTHRSVIAAGMTGAKAIRLDETDRMLNCHAHLAFLAFEQLVYGHFFRGRNCSASPGISSASFS